MKFKPSHLALTAVALGTALSASAQQQVGVEIYGLIGASVTAKTHQGAANGGLNEVSTNALNVSYLGFRGREDLGGGLNAVFRLETSLATDSGLLGKPNGTSFFDRQSFVGLSGSTWGSVTVGRQFHALTDRTIRTLDVYQVAAVNAHVVPLSLYGVNRYAGNDNRSSNAIKYRLDQPQGVQAGLSYALGEVTDSQSKGSSYSWDLAYLGKGYSVGGGLSSFSSPSTLGTTGILPKHQVWAVGGSMDFGDFRPYLAYYNSTLDSATTAGLKTQSNKITNVSLAWKATPLLVIKGAYYTDKGTALNNVSGRDGKKNTVVASAEYFLSKRTSVNAIVANNSLSAGYLQEPLYTAALGRNPNATSVQFYGLGINHHF